ncbi:acyl-CoA dehydrogenase family protein [Spirulina subsalsa]|uniref:acyl-CoA dehydrogenase family protein n=1 Tax=Spirulina subsalsa TaxID=54311 RepID=UPI0002DA3C3D|nr:acyl-CoA dehydrogenase family protein [Spirulina subsalsa]
MVEFITSSSPVLAILETALTEIASTPEELEQDASALSGAIQILGRHNLLALRVPQRYGGRELGDLDWFCYQEAIAKYSGTLAFVQTQQQTAAAFLAGGENNPLKQQHLAQISQGHLALGVGFAHLRRETPPLKAIPTQSGYLLTGQIPWLTGVNIFTQAIIAATLPDTTILLTIIPLQTTTQTTGGSLTLSPPLNLAAMSGSHTVQADLQQWFVPHNQVISHKPANWLTQKDQQGILNPTPLILGCAQAGLAILEQARHKQDSPTLHHTLQKLTHNVLECRQTIREAQQCAHYPLEEKYNLRARAIHLATRCAHAAVIVSRGTANLSTHPAQRIYREALVFTVTGQTTAILDATLRQLIS